MVLYTSSQQLKGQSGWCVWHSSFSLLDFWLDAFFIDGANP